MKKSNKAPGAFGKKLVRLTLALFAGYLAYSYFSVDEMRPKTVAEMSKTSVKIVRMDRRSGGTGVILKSSPSESTILTNGHVCHVVENGGLVITDNGEHAVASYMKSEVHDLCLVSVAANLHVNTAIAEGSPDLYSDAAISGHPSLLPNVVTRGHFSGRQIVEIMTGIRKCTTEEEGSDDAILCMLIGGIPQVRRYEAQLVTATIKPGSSGSAVFNAQGEISALVFAGSGDLGYAEVVPFEAISNFVRREQRLLLAVKPNDGYDVSAKTIMGSLFGNRTTPSTSMGEVPQTEDQRIATACLTPNSNPKLVKTCRMIQGDMIWRD